jgi:methionyl aminopeptidase
MRMRRKKIEIKSASDIDAMRKVGRLAAETLHAVDALIRPGITTEEINEFVHEDTLQKDCVPAPLNYRGFPKSVCTSINEVICHGIPGPRQLVEGDIINVDITHIHEGFYGDNSATFYVGEVSDNARHITEVARRSLELSIAEVRDGARLGDIGAAIQEFAEANGCGVVRDFVGHGIGRRFHMEPMVSHVGRRGTGPKLKAGMIFTIEPMINGGTPEVRVLEDGWTAVTRDSTLSAQFEHTILVTATGAEILTVRPGPLAHSELYSDYFDNVTTRVSD